MQKYQSIISGTNGSVIRNVPVTVLKEDGSLAEIFLDREGQVPASNPLATDSRGVFYFYAVNGRYSLRTSVDGITITDADAVLLNDPEEIATAGPIADAVLRAEAAAQRAELAVEASGIPELVGAAQNAVEDANTALQGAQSAAQLADDAKTQAASAKNAAELAQQASDTAKTGAENARSLAEQAADQARVYAESIDPAQFVQKEVGKGLMTEVERLKLADIAEQATKNATDDALRDRSTHTGTQPIATVTGLQTALDSKLSSSGGVLSGDLTVPSLNGGQLAGMRNKIINGNFGVNQRGVSGTVTLAAGAYGHDRWKAGASGCTYTYATTQNVTTITITAGSLMQVIEGLNLQSGTHVLSWTGTAQGRVDNGAYGASGEVTGTAVGGTNQTIEFNAGTVSRVQYEPGTVSTPFEHRLYPAERELCLRYFFSGYSVMSYTYISELSFRTATLTLPVMMRAVPSFSISASTGTQIGVLPGTNSIRATYQVATSANACEVTISNISAEV